MFVSLPRLLLTGDIIMSDYQEKFILAAGAALSLFVFLNEAGNTGNIDGLPPGIITNAAITGERAIRER
jgi:hypothetical protein